MFLAFLACRPQREHTAATVESGGLKLVPGTFPRQFQKHPACAIASYHTSSRPTLMGFTAPLQLSLQKQNRRDAPTGINQMQFRFSIFTTSRIVAMMGVKMEHWMHGFSPAVEVNAFVMMFVSLTGASAFVYVCSYMKTNGRSSTRSIRLAGTSFIQLVGFLRHSPELRQEL
jgi:hypothetical protein